MKTKLLSAVVLGLSLASMVAVAQDAKSQFVGKLAPVGAAVTATKSLNMKSVPDYSIRVNNNSAFLIYATAYDGYGGQTTFAIDPHYAATIQNYVYRSNGYRIRVLSDVGLLIYDGNVSSLTCVDVFEGALGPYARINSGCLQPY